MNDSLRNIIQKPKQIISLVNRHEDFGLSLTIWARILPPKTY